MTDYISEEIIPFTFPLETSRYETYAEDILSSFIWHFCFITKTINFFLSQKGEARSSSTGGTSCFFWKV